MVSSAWQNSSLYHLTKSLGGTIDLPFGVSHPRRSGWAGTKFITFGAYETIIIS